MPHTSNMDLSKYQKKTDKQHILDNPDTYIGSVELTETKEFICDNENIVPKDITINPGLYKIFDEGIVNCRDHVMRMQQNIDNGDKTSLPVTYIDISIADDGTITMINDGNGIDIAKHPEYNIWIPELVFGHLRTSTNYNKEEKKIVGGKNGFGFKLVLIWSTYGNIETIDHTRGLKYSQTFLNNLDTIEEPTIVKCKNKPYTKVSFKPDYKRLGLDQGITPDIYNHLKRRVYDIAAVTNKNIKVKFNSQLVPIKNLQQYITKIVGTTGIKYEQPNDRWEYGIALSTEGEFYHVSFVNGIYTSKGGKHVDYIINQIISKIQANIKEKKKIDVKPAAIKEQLALFLRCDIENPNFDSQTKDYLNTPVSKFGSVCKVSDEFIDKIIKLGVANAACQITEIKETKLLKKNDGSKTKNIRGIPKLIDANLAGTNKSFECTLILCEGDSAKAGIVSGLSKEDRNIIGIYPMKGKLLNVRGESITKIGANKEITEIKHILGLEHGKEYDKDIIKNKLRYGSILFMTDQDLDGSHIKGLCINLFDSTWQSLLEIPNFLGFMNTPILKATKGNKIEQFYNDGEFNKWKNENPDFNTWKIKYYKGLGTSTSKEFKEYFNEKKIVTFKSTGIESKNKIDMIFNKKRSDDRKNWLGMYNRNNYLDTSKHSVTYEEFIDKELMHFSKYDNDRSIPSLLDGQKISLRKILFAAFKKNLTTEIKVAQFSGYVSEHSGYHHGEASLNAAIVGLAQTFVGSNNINLLMPSGQFGTRLKGGKDASSERYIFTKLNTITRIIFNKDDDAILDYLNDDGVYVEPIYYIPIIPMILVNGTKGIGTGFSTDIMPYNPLEIIKFIKAKLTNNNIDIELHPYYKGFIGKILQINPNKYLISGIYNKISNNTIKITELPIGTWTQDYKEFLENMLDNKQKDYKPIIKDFNDMSTDINVDFTIEFFPGVLSLLENKNIDISGNEYQISELEKLLKLTTTHTNTNMHLFDHNEHLHKFNSVYEILECYYPIRLQFYEKRKQYKLKIIENELVILSNKARFMTDILNDTIDLRKKTKSEIYNIFIELKYDGNPNIDEDNKKFNYLSKMPMDSVSQEEIEYIINERDKKENEMLILVNTTIEEMWLEELDTLEKEYKSISSNKKSKK